MHHKPLLRTAALVLALGVSTTLSADENQIKYRKNTMSALGGHMGAIVQIMKKQVEHPDHLGYHAIGLNETSKAVGDVFPEGSDTGGDTEVIAAVWEDPEGFEQAVSMLQQAAAGFLAAVESGDQSQLGPALKELGGSCKNCHDNYRKKKE